MAFSLELISGAGAGQKQKLSEGAALVVGRTEKAQFQVAGDATLSGAHFEVKVTAGKVMVRDVGSRAGTFVQGARIEGEVELKAGDRVQAGQSAFLLDEVAAFGSWTLESTPKDWDDLPGQGYKERVESGPFSNIVFTEEAQDFDKALAEYVADQKLILRELRPEWTVGEGKPLAFAGAEEAMVLEIRVPAGGGGGAGEGGRAGEAGRAGEVRQLYVRRAKRFGTATLTASEEGMAAGLKAFEQTLRGAKFEPAAGGAG